MNWKPSEIKPNNYEFYIFKMSDIYCDSVRYLDNQTQIVFILLFLLQIFIKHFKYPHTSKTHCTLIWSFIPLFPMIVSKNPHS